MTLQYNRLSMVGIALLFTVLCTSEAYNCYRDTDKASKPQDLSEISSQISSESSSERRRRRDTSLTRAVLEFDVEDYVNIPQLDPSVLSDEFTISLWVYLEGGQPSGGRVLGLRNTCYLYSPWSLSLQKATRGFTMKSKLSFSIEDVYRQRKAVFMDTYKHHTWFHVAVVNNVNQMRMYVDGVRVSTGVGMKWKDYTDLACLHIHIGHKTKGFRGKVKDLLLSSRALSAKEVKQISADIISVESLGWLSVQLSQVRGDWSTESPPSSVEVFTNQKSGQKVSAPACGKTVCDDPAIVTAYATDTQLKQKKVVDMEILVLADNDGSRPVASVQRIEEIKGYISDAFKPANISWNFETRLVKNSTLRSASVMLDCWPDMIGDGYCDSVCNPGRCCNFTETNFDGGDCIPKGRDCYANNINDSICDSACNIGYYAFDYGDCCQSALDNSQCFDPFSKNRRYFHISEIKNSLQTSDDKISVIALDWMNRDQMKGIASMPWERNPDSIFGSAIVDVSVLKESHSFSTIVHELGHTLGLWHVHHGISEIPCTDECVEKEPSLELGDLCSDTPPTATHTSCNDPKLTLGQVCAVASALTNTPYNNYMSYSNGSCSDNKHFTRQQTARMHCYLDLVYGSMLEGNSPSAIPLPPQVVYADTGSVTFSWLPPLSSGEERKMCSQCDSDHRLIQYAISAVMTGSERYSVSVDQKSGPEHATGVPDSASCKETKEIWYPIAYYVKLFKSMERTSPGLQFNFTFKYPARPQSLSVWIPLFQPSYGDTPITSILLYSPSGNLVKTIYNVHVQCDKPYTKRLDIQDLIDKVVINTNTPYIGFDAVQLVSGAKADQCTDCESIQYELLRTPPFNSPVIVTETIFEDKTVEVHKEYVYTVVPKKAHRRGVLSKPFKYVHNQQFCGNGNLDGVEECDDGNLSAGDGCSTHCVEEDNYVCEGVPSVCWLDIEPEGRHCSYKFTHETNGCGYYVPEGYADQWASSVTPIGRQLRCSPEHLLLGPPPPTLKCHSTLSDLDPPLWFPCNLSKLYDGDSQRLDRRYSHKYQLKMGFERAVVITEVLIHIGTDGGTDSGTITVSQTFEGEHTMSTIGTVNSWALSCRNSPLQIPVYQYLSAPFKRSKVVILDISSRSISIAAVRIRTFGNYDPVTLSSCNTQLYNTATNQCHRSADLSSLESRCLPMQVTNGTMTCTGSRNGDICSVLCDVGFKSNTVSSVSTCMDGEWQPRLQCNVVMCTRPVVTLGYASCPDGHHSGSICHINCVEPSQLQGNGSIIKCLESGVWSEARAVCLPKCPDLTHQNVELTEDLCVGEQNVQSRCHITCKPGYFIEKSNTKTKKAKAKCLKSGEWSERCIRVKCPPVPKVWKAIYTCTDGENSGSLCTAKCPESQKMHSVSCSNVGRWNASFSACQTLAVQCESIMFQSRSDYTINCTGNTFESVCRVVCKNKTHVLYHTNQVGTQVEITEFRDKLKCDILKRWSPALESLSCAPFCKQESIGDGWCDSSNNRAICRYDGGDCCPSTSKTNQVQNYPETCTSGCWCRDPGAIENS